jgi:hypothetical protein
MYTNPIDVSGHAKSPADLSHHSGREGAPSAATSKHFNSTQSMFVYAQPAPKCRPDGL